MRNARGFSLLELAAAMGIAGTLALIALPGIQNAKAAVHETEVRTRLYETWIGAVRHATVSGSEVVLCPGDLGGCRATTVWSDGWVVFEDRDGDRKRSPDEVIIKSAGALEQVLLQSTSGRTLLVFQPDGSNAGSNVTWTLCDRRGAVHARAVIVSNSGRIRLGKPSATAAAHCASAL